MGLSDEFCDDARKQAQWRAFLTKGRLVEDEMSLREVAEFLRTFLMPAYSGPFRPLIPVGSRPPIPVDPGHPIRWKSAA